MPSSPGNVKRVKEVEGREIYQAYVGSSANPGYRDVRFPEEGHELSRSGKPKHREERLRHLVRWMKKYLEP